jgi:hypothetical protein
MLAEISQRCILLAVKIERITVRVTQMMGFCRKAGKELLLSCAEGCLYGTGVGLFVFSHLGFPRDINLAGYVSGLFIVAGVKLGFSVWVIRSLISPLVRRSQDSKSESELP